tara:strand:+ start:970 stop:1311 length:342 start_codon:yes stop_codon:yes gene_type:complete
MVILPDDIINIILFEYLDDIELKINFCKIKKLNIEKYNFLNKIISSNISSFSLFHRKGSSLFVYRYINISKGKHRFYRITYEIIDNYDYIEITTEICNDRIPMYTSLISNNMM